MLRSRRQIGRSALTVVPIQTSAGAFIAHFSERGLAQLDFPDSGTSASAECSIAVIRPQCRDWIKLTEQALSAILTGYQPRLLPPLDLQSGTIFQQRIWTALQNISVGHTKTYAEVAEAIGSPNATRAVGGACGANPIPLLIPCHRVLASGGKLGGFSAGLKWKVRLLAAERILLTETPCH